MPRLLLFWLVSEASQMSMSTRMIFKWFYLTWKSRQLAEIHHKTGRWACHGFRFLCDTVDGGRFAWLKSTVSVPSKFSRKYFRVALAISAHNLVQLKRVTHIHGKTFAILLKTIKMWKFSPANLSLFMVCGAESSTDECHFALFSSDLAFFQYFVIPRHFPILHSYSSACGISYSSKTTLNGRQSC